MVKNKSNKKYLETLVRKMCDVTTKEKGASRASVVTGRIKKVDYDGGFILIDTQHGLECISIDTIIAVYKK